MILLISSSALDLPTELRTAPLRKRHQRIMENQTILMRHCRLLFPFILSLDYQYVTWILQNIYHSSRVIYSFVYRMNSLRKMYIQPQAYSIPVNLGKFFAFSCTPRTSTSNMYYRPVKLATYLLSIVSICESVKLAQHTFVSSTYCTCTYIGVTDRTQQSLIQYCKN